MGYLTDAVNPKRTPQARPIPGRTDMVENSAGGYVWQIDCWTRLKRFLIMGTEGGSYYAGERELTQENAEAIYECLREDGPKTVEIIKDISVRRRAPKPEPAIFAHVIASMWTEDESQEKAGGQFGKSPTRTAAYDTLSAVCRTGTHLFTWVEFRTTMGKWSRGARQAVARWYTEKDPDYLALQVVKYQSRAVGGEQPMTHDRILRMVHPGMSWAPTEDLYIRKILEWVAEPEGGSRVQVADSFPPMIQGYRSMKQVRTPQDAVALIEKFNMPHESIPTDIKATREVWAAMLPDMPLTAMIRNLANMTRYGVLTPTAYATGLVQAKLQNVEHLRKSGVHPVHILLAAFTYKAGRSVRGSNTWVPIPQILDSLDQAFYDAFENIPSTGLRRMIGLDISGSMWGGMVAGIPGLTPAIGAGAMSMCSIKSGDPYEVTAFTSASRYGRGQQYHRLSGGIGTVPSDVVQPLDGLSVHQLSPRMRIDDVVNYMESLSYLMGGTNPSLVMQYAQKAEREVDVFEIYTDAEAWAGDRHAAQALNDYRKASGIDAKLVCVAMVPNRFTVADPNDPGMLDVIGFDTITPQLIADFAGGELG